MFYKEIRIFRSAGFQLIFLTSLAFLVADISLAVPPGYVETDVDWQGIQMSTSARQTWLQNRPLNYVYDMRRECFCPYRAVRVFVLSGRVAQVEDMQSGEVITDEAELRKFRTLDEINDWLDHLWRRGADAFMIKRNPHLGYPEEINIDPTYRMLNEEIQEKIVRFRLLKKAE